VDKSRNYTLKPRLKPVIVVIDRPLLKRIDKAAEKLGINRSVFIRQAAEAKLNA
jgi:metal-responsive CopG/Arc/MetJ family transcriptional regulator